MPRANDPTSKVFYKGSSDDFIVFVDDAQALNNWRKDRSIPLADVLNGWKIFTTHRYVNGTHGEDPSMLILMTTDTAPRASSTAPARRASRTSSGLPTKTTSSRRFWRTVNSRPLVYVTPPSCYTL